MAPVIAASIRQVLPVVQVQARATGAIRRDQPVVQVQAHAIEAIRRDQPVVRAQARAIAVIRRDPPVVRARTGIRQVRVAVRAQVRVGVATTTTIPQDRAAALARTGKTRRDHVVDLARRPIAAGVTATGGTATGAIATGMTAGGTIGGIITGKTAGLA